jgi:hypothetical protein
MGRPHQWAVVADRETFCKESAEQQTSKYHVPRLCVQTIDR